MGITLNKEKSIELGFQGGTLIVTYRIPNAIDVEDLESGIKNYVLLRKFVKTVESDIEGLDSVEKLLMAPGSAKTVEKIALAILSDAFWTEPEKEAEGAVLTSV